MNEGLGHVTPFLLLGPPHHLTIQWWEKSPIWKNPKKKPSKHLWCALAHTGKRTAWGIMTKFCLWVEWCPGPNHACNFWWWSVKGCGRGEGSNFPFPIDLRRRPYNTLSLPCNCVIYNIRTLRISGSRVSGCRYSSYGNVYWTAGQRIDPSRNTPFIWRVKSTDTNSETVSQMSYTNWHPGEPNNYRQAEPCMNLWSDRSYRWNDQRCSNDFCSVCELDI